MTEKEFVRALVAECKRNGYRISQPNVKKVINPKKIKRSYV